MKKRALLIIGLALLVATAGVVYAHWQDTLTMNATVNTGTVNMMWQAFGTDDDGDPSNDPSGNDNNGPTQIYDAWGTASSADPAEMWRCGFGTCGYKLGPDLSLSRYDKDVAKCTVVADGAKGLTATITNAYPSYHCTVFSQLSNEGTVPVKATAFRLTTPPGGTLMYAGTEWVEAAAGTTAWCNTINPASGLPNGFGVCPSGIFVGGVPVITFDFADGTACGNQLDPYLSPAFDNDKNAVWFHVEQAAAQNASYAFHWEQDFVNWNEWSADLCTVTVNGTQVYPLNP